MAKRERLAKEGRKLAREFHIKEEASLNRFGNKGVFRRGVQSGFDTRTSENTKSDSEFSRRASVTGSLRLKKKLQDR